MTKNNAVYVGKKNVMSYVLAVVTIFNKGEGEVQIMSRGRSISKAVDIAEITRNRFLPEVKVSDIKIGTEEMTTKEGTKTKVSTIEITLKK
ncbi:DNA/RNA-binding protein albA [archaeon BMS3Abin16]|nr:DNA/RNA-binding protein albA [archaeon BMS3Abin16]HDY74628.1 DNA-binding protein Alba [Euryarchaeota archaeon]